MVSLCRHKIRSVVVAVVMSIAHVGCSNPVSDAPNVFPWDDLGATPDAGVPLDASDTGSQNLDGVGGDGCADCPAVDTWYRFDALVLTTVGGKDSTDQLAQQLMDVLNTTWGADIIHSELNVLLKVTSAENGALSIEISNGARVGNDGTFCRMAETAVPLNNLKDGCSLTSEGSSSLAVFAGSIESPKSCALELPSANAIPIVDVSVAATTNSDCTSISGTVAGKLAQDDFDQVCSCLDIAALGNSGAPHVPSDEACGTLEAGFQTDDGKCKGCNDNYIHLGTIVNVLFPGVLDFTSDADAGGRAAVPITADFTAQQIDAPNDCN